MVFFLCTWEQGIGIESLDPCLVCLNCVSLFVSPGPGTKSERLYRRYWSMVSELTDCHQVPNCPVSGPLAHLMNSSPWDLSCRTAWAMGLKPLRAAWKNHRYTLMNKALFFLHVSFCKWCYSEHQDASTLDVWKSAVLDANPEVWFLDHLAVQCLVFQWLE
jgi:hypothetical protein